MLLVSFTSACNDVVETTYCKQQKSNNIPNSISQEVIEITSQMLFEMLFQQGLAVVVAA